MPGLTGLPNEVLLHIAQFPPGIAIKALRLSSTQLHRAASPFLFRVLYLSCHPLDIEVFHLVLANPVLISGVEELVIMKSSSSMIRLSHPRSLTGARFASWPCKRNYFGHIGASHTSRMMMALSHHRNRRVDADVAALTDALPRMPSPRKLILTNRTVDECPPSGPQSQESSSPTVKLWRRCGQEYKATTVSSQLTIDTLNDEVRADLPYLMGHEEYIIRLEAENRIREAAGRVVRVARGLRVALVALANPGLRSRLTEFRIDPSRDIIRDGYQPVFYQPGLACTIFDNRSPVPDQLTSLLGFCSHLTTLHLSLSNSGASQAQHVIEQGNVARVLAALPNLQELFLEVHTMQIWLAIPQDMVYTKLRRVRIACSDVWPKKFMSFIRQHVATLEELCLEHCGVTYDALNPWRVFEREELVSPEEIGT
ncbi:hypothetical protein EDB81DRAFT_860942 [Dactylonectria macrodidyma]|uniref:F-box domain-containing protein n=1 Tax=Dactylonectria macrodidyma TaxID=307937 RepID=A0A9P9ILG0_9HYPO|nr:hypothetical protein EDB81DRAFT_860942 [Dactylonectria macrodidyma]